MLIITIYKTYNSFVAWDCLPTLTHFPVQVTYILLTRTRAEHLRFSRCILSIVVIYCEHTYSLFPPLKHISYFYDDWSILKAEVNNSLCISSRNNRWSDIKVRRKQHVYITTPFMPVFLFLVESGTEERPV